MVDRKLREVAQAVGYEPLSHRMQLRVSETTFDRVSTAASECDMTVNDWVRAIIDSALDVHEEREKMILAGIDPDEVLTDEEQGPPVETADEYAERIRTEAQALREADGPRTPPPIHREPKISPRECVHPLTRRQGPKCRLCGTTVGMIRSSGTGRYLGSAR